LNLSVVVLDYDGTIASSGDLDLSGGAHRPALLATNPNVLDRPV
jgi:sugar diacid utilization regulator